MTARGITIASASAGSGKTYRLTQDVTAAVDPNGKTPVPLEGLVAVTYTTKAHAELTARIRQKLVRTGAFDEAARLPLAYLGTVHAACLRLLQEFAIDAGLSPTVDVVAGDQGRLLREALEHSLEAKHRERLDALARTWELRKDSIAKRVDWITPVADIMDLARSNRIAPEALQAMAERSAVSFLKLLPSPEKDGEALEDALAKELTRAAKKLEKQDDGTKKTADAKEAIREAIRRHRDGELVWSDWAKLSRLTPGVACRSAVVDLVEVATRYERHPRLHAEARELTSLLYEAARIGLSGYRDWKRDKRVVDYVDMLDGALDLLDHRRVKDELASRLKFVVVDEFQDTSPIQLALFVKLHALAKRSVWVGDRKQCIFEYAGADPQLMDAVADWVARHEGQRDTLDTNYRSRPELVAACSELFAAGLARHGFSRDEVVVKAHRKTPQALESLPPFGVWCLESTKGEEDCESIAEGVRRMLAKPSATPIVDRTTHEVRDVRAGDIAILVATNAEARNIATALHARGIRSAIARAGLLRTPEGSIADAALRWLLDDRDSLSAAKIDALMGFGGATPDAWLEATLTKDAADSAWRAPLARVREKLGVLSPSEALDEAFAALDAVQLCARWPDPAQRIANLDALRALAADYEDRCEQEHEAATLAGLLRHFDDMATERIRRDEPIASDDQHVPTDDGAVIVCTYHRSKGLEWPVVVMGSLDKSERRHAFEVCPETDRVGFDPEKPLEGRWIRYWPWPFGATTKVPLREAGETSAFGAGVAAREEKDRARLLYVGFTRARDHLVLAVRTKPKAKCAWLEGLVDAKGEPLLGLPTAAADDVRDAVTIRAAKAMSVAARVWRVGPSRVEEERKAAAHRWFAVPVARPAGEEPAYWILPSNAAEDWPKLAPKIAAASLGEAHRLGTPARPEQAGLDYTELGKTAHAFFAADVAGIAAEQRVAMATRLLSNAGLLGAIRPESLVEASDALRAFVDTRWPGATWHREIPVDAQLAGRRVAGIIDLALETKDGLVLLDHKTFPGPTEGAWRAKCAEFVPQIVAYGESLAVTEAKLLGCWIHLPVGGGMLEVRLARQPR